MIGSIQTTVERAPIDPTMLVETWQTGVVDTNQIKSRLTQQWLRLKGPRPQRLSGLTRASGEAPESEVASRIYARTNTTNLIVVARSSAQVARGEWAIAGLQTHYPTRAITVGSDPGLDRPAVDTDRESGPITISTRLVRPDSGSPVVGHFESITVLGGPRRLGNPLNTALPLSVSDLPIVVWWVGDMQYDFGVFRDMTEASDRMIVDTAGLGDVQRGLTTLAPLAKSERQRTGVLADMAWLRLRDWRNLIAQFYDAPPHPDALSAIGTVTVAYVADPEPGQVSGLSSAMLLVGWLASRLGWRLDDRLTRTSSGLRLVFTSSGNRPVIVRLHPSSDGVATTGLSNVTVTSSGVARAEFRIEQFSESELLTTSILPDHPPMTRHVIVSPHDDSALLESVLRDAGRDPVFDDALATIADIFARR
jgi:glucose-6-phosphate dehydrogenase assembly protein OpcA